MEKSLETLAKLVADANDVAAALSADPTHANSPLFGAIRTALTVTKQRLDLHAKAVVKTSAPETKPAR